MRIWYHFARGLCQSFFAHTCGVEVRGQHHVPASGGLLLACNHVSFMDPPLISICLEREIHFLARKSLFKKNGFGALITSLNSIPVDQDRPDMNGPRLIIKHLQQGDAVLLFPEGARSYDGKLQKGQPGAGLIACKAGVPVLPLRIRGAFEAWPRGQKKIKFHPLLVTIGAPFTVPPAEKRDREAYQKASDLMMQKIAEL